jgi:hypothetical protein
MTDAYRMAASPLQEGAILTDDRLDEHVAEIRRLVKRTVEDIVEIGRRLTECKKLSFQVVAVAQPRV